MIVDDPRRLAAEFIGTAVLMSAIVGSGIVTSTGGPASAQLFQHAVVVGGALLVLINVLGPVSGAHFNPAVTAAAWWFNGMPVRRAYGYVLAQLGGAMVGAALTNVMFGEPAVSLAGKPRTGFGLIAGEALATAGLLVVIFALVRLDRSDQVPASVATWIATAIFFTTSAAFANPAVAIARMLSDTWTGIAPSSVPGFLAGETLGTVAAIGLVTWMFRPDAQDAADVVVPAQQTSTTPTTKEPAS